MKIAVVGTGMIAREALNALRMVRGVEIPVLCARAHSRKKAERMAQEFNIPHVVQSCSHPMRPTLSTSAL